MKRAAGDSTKMVPSESPAALRGRDRADADCLAGMQAARAALPTVPEFTSYSDPSGKTWLMPTAAMAAGLLDHLEAAYERNHDADGQSDPTVAT